MSNTKYVNFNILDSRIGGKLVYIIKDNAKKT